MNVVPGFSLSLLVLLACATLTAVQSQRANSVGDTASDPSESARSGSSGSSRSGSTRANGAGSSGSSSECASNRRNCLNYHEQANDALNSQVNTELSASYAYTAMGQYFASVDGSLRGCSLLFLNQAAEEMSHANQFMGYIISRGGSLNFTDIRTPQQTTFSSCMEAMETALNLEIQVTEAILVLYDIANEHGDQSLADFLDQFIQEQVSSVDELAHFVTILERFNGDPVGEYMFDESLYTQLSGSA